MELKQLRRFLVVAELKNFHAASEVLHITQPALSQSIQKLEGSVGELLFLRGTRGVELTKFGKLLVPRAKLILKFGDDFIHDLEVDKQRRNAHIKVGVSSYLARGLFVDAFDRFNKRMPDVYVDVLEDQGLKLIEALEHGHLDLAFCGLVGKLDDHPSIAFDRFYTVKYALCARKGHPIFATSSDSASNVTGYPWAIHDRVTLGKSFSSALRQAGLDPPKYTVESESLQIILSLVCATDHIAFIGKDFAFPELSSGRLAEIEHDIEFFHEVETEGGIFTLKGAPKSKAVSVMIEAMQNVCAERDNE